MENNANQLNPMLCKRNCGFFGNAAYDGYCSKCYKDHVKRQNSGSAAGRVTPTSNAQSTTTTTIPAAPITSTETLTLQPEASVQATTLTPVESTTPVAITTTMTQPIAIPARHSTTSSESAAVPMAVSMSDAAAPPAVLTTVSPSSSDATAGGAVSSTGQQLKFGVESMISASCIEPVATLTSNPSSSTQLSSSVMSTGDDSMILSTSLPTSSAAATGGSSTTPPATEKKKRTRCCVESCKRKVGLTGFDCRCGGLYCWEHRYSDKHDCKFDYKEHGQDQIRKNNPIVVGEKIQKI